MRIDDKVYLGLGSDVCEYGFARRAKRTRRMYFSPLESAPGELVTEYGFWFNEFGLEIWYPDYMLGQFVEDTSWKRTWLCMVEQLIAEGVIRPARRTP